MGKKKTLPAIDPNSIFQSATNEYRKKEFESKGKNLDVISFAKIHVKRLHRAQEIILKFIYAGTRYNEELEITEADIETIRGWDIYNKWFFESGVDSKSKLEIVREWCKNPKEKKVKDFFRTIQLVIGRRSGKTFITALIAAYETYKVLLHDRPQDFFGKEADLYIIVTARTKDQATKEVFAQIRRFVYASPFFEGRITKDLESELHLATNHDIQDYERIRKNTKAEMKGSIIIIAGTSNSQALRGHSAIVVIYDEMAHYVDTDGDGSPEEVWRALSPSTKTFTNKGEGRNIIISSPKTAYGFFYKRFLAYQHSRNALVFQIPTWNANDEIDKADLEEEAIADPDGFRSEYGSEFLLSSGNAFFSSQYIERAFTVNLNNLSKLRGTPGYSYYMHIDPAKTMDHWAIMICHPEYRFDENTGKYVQHAVEDYSAEFDANTFPNKVLDPNKIMDDYILPLYKSFRIVYTTFDNMFSLEQRDKLVNRGIRFKEMSFAGVCKNKYYETTRDLLMLERIELCNDDMKLKNQLSHIIVDHSRSSSEIKNDKSEECSYDDLVDCLCSLTYIMLEGEKGITTLPKPKLVYTGRR